MQIAFMYAVRATVWFPVSTRPLTREIVIPAKSVIQIKGAGCAYNGTIIANMPGIQSLHINAPHSGNINFFNDGEEVYGYKEFDPRTAEEFLIPTKA